MNQILTDVTASSRAQEVDVRFLQSTLGCFWSSWHVITAIQVFRDWKIIFFLCSGNGVLNTGHGFLAVAIAFFQIVSSLVCLQKSLAVSVEMSNVREVPFFVVVFHVFCLLMYRLRRHLEWEMDGLTHVCVVDTTLRDKLIQGRKHFQLQMLLYTYCGH